MSNPKKTSKTAHVLNVLSSGSSNLSDSQTAAFTSAPALATVPALEIDAPDDIQLSETIRKNLLLELEDIEKEDSITASPHYTLSPNIPSSQRLKSTNEQKEDSKASYLPELLSANETSNNVPDDILLQESPEYPDRYFYMNILEPLVDEKADKYMNLLDVCNCPRCKADVRAIALTNLLPKYLVMNRRDCTKMHSYYENQFDSAITTQLILACQNVMADPQH